MRFQRVKTRFVQFTIFLGLMLLLCAECCEEESPTLPASTPIPTPVSTPIPTPISTPIPTPAPTPTLPAHIRREEYAGYIWYMNIASRGLSCDVVCANYGGCNKSGIVLIGSRKSEKLCNTLLDLFGIPPYTLVKWKTSKPKKEGAGCAEYYGDPIYYGRVIAYPATCEASSMPYSQAPRRVCACYQ